MAAMKKMSNDQNVKHAIKHKKSDTALRIDSDATNWRRGALLSALLEIFRDWEPEYSVT